MSLHVISTPIGNPKDITLRAIEVLKDSDLIIGEDRKPTALFLRSVDLRKDIDLLNEHSDEKDIKYLLEQCKTKKVALVSDCGTPSFCDPGFQLVLECKKSGIQVTPVPGVSSLMTLLSMVSKKIESFYFFGFLPRKDPDRGSAIKTILKSKESVVVMDTAYRIRQTLEQFSSAAPLRNAMVGMNMTKESEVYLEGSLKHIFDSLNTEKAEFVLIIYP